MIELEKHISRQRDGNTIWCGQAFCGHPTKEGAQNCWNEFLLAGYKKAAKDANCHLEAKQQIINYWKGLCLGRPERDRDVERRQKISHVFRMIDGFRVIQPVLSVNSTPDGLEVEIR